jgi:hypothetical protein
MDIERSGFAPWAKGPAEWFSGTVGINAPFKGSGDARASGAILFTSSETR